MTSCLACSPDSTKPTVETPSRLSGIQQTRKKKARPAARKSPLSAKKRENAPRMASMGRSEQPAHQAAVHLHRHPRHIRRALGGAKHAHVRELFGSADASDRHGF